jgi:hypothetical protein
MSIEELEVRVAALEAKFMEEIDRLYVAVFPEIDSAIERAINYACATSSHALDESQKLVGELGDRVVQTEQTLSGRFEKTVEGVKSLESNVAETIRETVDKLIAASSSEGVAKALLRALTSTIIKTRPATREEIKSGDGVLAIRQATPAELR